jgi:hypothetical protein
MPTAKFSFILSFLLLTSPLMAIISYNWKAGEIYMKKNFFDSFSAIFCAIVQSEGNGRKVLLG